MSLNPIAREFVYSSHSVPVTYQSTWVHNQILNLPIASATANVKNDWKGQQNAESATAQMPCPNTRHTDPSVNERQNISTPAATTVQGLIELAKSLADQVSLNRLPPPEPSMLFGDPIQYPAWKAAFKTLIDRRCIPAAERFYVAFLGGTGGASKCSMIVPVLVSHCENPEREILVNALLDTQSDTSFILEDTCNDLGLSFIGVKLSLSTMYAEKRVIDSQNVKGLIVRGFNNSLRISLPDTFTRNIMPANRTHIPTPDMAKMWPHLEAISDKLMSLSQCEIGLLIGYNCPRALLPREVIPPVGDGPFGQKTDFGWGIVGVIDPCQIETDTLGVSHRVVALEVPINLYTVENPQSEQVLFSLKTTVKEVKGADVLRVMEHEFCDPVTDVASYSQEDRRFLTLLDQGISFQNGHYEMSLPFKKENPILPNNKSMAIRRLQCLRTRFKKDKKFCHDYFEFMNSLCQKWPCRKGVRLRKK